MLHFLQKINNNNCVTGYTIPISRLNRSYQVTKDIKHHKPFILRTKSYVIYLLQYPI